MNWKLDTTSFANLANAAFKKAQEKIDQMLEIEDEDNLNATSEYYVNGYLDENMDMYLPHQILDDNIESDNKSEALLIPKSNTDINSGPLIDGQSTLNNHQTKATLQTSTSLHNLCAIQSSKTSNSLPNILQLANDNKIPQSPNSKITDFLKSKTRSFSFTTSSELEILSMPTVDSRDSSSEFTNLLEIKLSTLNNCQRKQNKTQIPMPKMMAKTHSFKTFQPYDQKNLIYNQNFTDQNELQKLSAVITDSNSFDKDQKNENCEILRIREEQLLKVSQENAKLKEQINHLKSIHVQEIDNFKKDMENQMTEHQNKLTLVNKEKMSVEKLLKDVENTKNMQIAQLNQSLNQQEQLIVELRSEGEKLSKQELKSAGILKKVRAREKELENALNISNKKLEECKKEIENLKSEFDSKEELEEENHELMQQMTTDNLVKQELLQELETKNSECQIKCQALQNGIENAYKQISSLQQEINAKEQKIKDLELHSEKSLQAGLEEFKAQLITADEGKRAHFTTQISLLKDELKQEKNIFASKETQLNQELIQLKQHLKQFETLTSLENQNLVDNLRPYINQIEELQNQIKREKIKNEQNLKQFTTEKKAFEIKLQEMSHLNATQHSIQTELQQRLQELSLKYSALETKLQENVEKCKFLEHSKSQLQMKYESEINSYKALETRLCTEIEALKTKLIISAENDKNSCSESHKNSCLKVDRNSCSNIDKSCLNLSPSVSQFNSNFLTNSLEYSRISNDDNLNLNSNLNSNSTFQNNGQKLQFSQQDLMFKNDENIMTRSSSSVTLSQYDNSTNYERTSDVLSDNYNTSLTEENNNSLFDIQQFQHLLRRKNGRIQRMNHQIETLQKQLSIVSNELVLNNDVRAINTELMNKIENTSQELNQLKTRYSALLEMYGEKEENIQELRLDLEELKTLYRDQLNLLTHEKL